MTDGDKKPAIIQKWVAGSRSKMTSVIIAAHNEASLIGRCLDALIGQESGNGPPDITVVANGCTDATAALARQYGARVVEIDEANKASALNIGDTVASGFPRIYLDADIEVPPGAITALAQALAEAKECLVAVPRRRMEVTARPPAVKAYYAINTRLQAFQNGLFGRGMIAMSERGRARFQVFPTMVADDLFLDSLFAPAEKLSVDSVEVVVETPWRTSDLIRRLTRVRRGNAAMREAARRGMVAASVRDADRFDWLRSVVLPQPQLAPAGVVYAAISLLAAILARLEPPSRDHYWARDDSTRHPDRQAQRWGP
jgi:glycosyltransferase involved in cell wall biosynthesis